MRRLLGPRFLAALALGAAACRRAGAPPPSPSATPLPRPAAVESADVARERRPPSDRHPVIWLGLDGLDWELLDRLAGEGKMPNWKRLT